MTGPDPTDNHGTDHGDGEPERGALWHRSAPAAALVVVLIAAAGIYLAVRGGGSGAGSHGTTAGPAAPAPGSATTAPGGRTSPPAGPTDTDQTVPTTTPTGVSWSLYDGVALPYSKTAGPTTVIGPVAAGYAHTPLGALIAADQIGVRYLITPSGGWRQVTIQQVLPGPGRDAYVSERAGVGDNPPAGGYGQSAGFRFVTYSPDAAVIELVTHFSSDQLQVTTSTVRWSGGDWRLELQPDGGASPTRQQIAELTGFVPWAGV